MADNGLDPFEQLESGMEQFVRFDSKSLLEYVMQDLGAPAPEFTLLQCPDSCVKVAIKLHLSSVISTRGERISYSVVEGDTSSNPIIAESTAISKAIHLLENNHMIKISNFSSRVSYILDNCNTQSLLAEGIVALENVIVHWNKLVVQTKVFSDELQRKELADYFGGDLSPIGLVYSVLSDQLSSIQSALHYQAEELISDFADMKSDMLKLEEKLNQRRQLDQMVVANREVEVPDKLLLEQVLSFYGLDNADYTNSPHPRRMVKSVATFEFPYLRNFQYGGKLATKGYGYDAEEAEENAAQKSLLFIEKHFKTHFIDYNYTKSKKSRKAQNKFMVICARAIEHGVSAKLMFEQFNNAIQCQLSQFSFDPTLYFSGPYAAGQTEAYHFCKNGLKELEQFSSQCYADCHLNFDVLQKLTWKLTAAKTSLPI